jgi:hypothetical protein
MLRLLPRLRAPLSVLLDRVHHICQVYESEGTLVSPTVDNSRLILIRWGDQSQRHCMLIAGVTREQRHLLIEFFLNSRETLALGVALSQGLEFAFSGRTHRTGFLPQTRRLRVIANDASSRLVNGLVRKLPAALDLRNEPTHQFIPVISHIRGSRALRRSVLRRRRQGRQGAFDQSLNQGSSGNGGIGTPNPDLQPSPQRRLLNDRRQLQVPDLESGAAVFQQAPYERTRHYEALS